MFVYIVGNVEQGMFKVGVADDPLRQLSSIQAGNPFKLSLISQVGVASENEAKAMGAIALRELGKHAGEGGWVINPSEALVEQFVSGHYLRMLASKVDAKPVDGRKVRATSGAGLQRLTGAAQEQGLSFEAVLARVELAYKKGVSIDSVMAE